MLLQVLFIYLFLGSSYTSYISSPCHYLARSAKVAERAIYSFFATHAHIIENCFAVVPRLCLSSLYLELSFFTLMSHIHKIILICAR